MKTQHTPGPWVASGRIVTAGISPGQPYICDCLPGERYREPGSTEANAKLIAAAPDLLEALESANLYCKQIRIAANIGRRSNASKVEWYESQLVQLANEVRAAIAKAKGEA